MRAAPACQVSLQRFGMWRGAVTVLALLGMASLAAWGLAREQPVDAWAFAAAALSALALPALASSLWGIPHAELRWDGRTWHLGASAGEPVAGELSVALDLGPWMLLRFVPATSAVRSRATWLPLQRRGLESQWHALRCAVYSPRPAPADDAPVGF